MDDRFLRGHVKGREGEALRIVATTTDVDRDGEVVESRGANVEEYRRNPVILAHHNWSTNPVGKAVAVDVLDDRIEMSVEWAPTAEGQELKALYDGGYMRSFSIGFIPEKSKMIDGRLHHVEWSLLEVSCVAIPSNAFAVALSQAEADGVRVAALRKSLREENMGQEKKTVEELQAELDQKDGFIELMKRQMKAGAFQNELEDDDQGGRVRVMSSPYRGVSLEKAKDCFLALRAEKDDHKSIEHAKANPKRLEAALKSFTDLVETAQPFDPSRKDLVGQTTTAGGFLVNDELRDEILSYGRYSSVALRRCRIERMASDVQLFPRENALWSLGFKAEGTEADETSPTFEQVSVTAKELTGYAEVSWALEQDASNLVGQLLDQVSNEFGLTMDEVVLDGDGDPMSGIFDNGGYSVILAGAAFSTVTVAKLREVMTKVPPKDRQGAAWITSPAFLWESLLSIQQDSKDVFGVQDVQRLFNHPIEESTVAPDATGSGVPVAVFGDLKSVIIGERLASTMTLFRNPYRKATERLTQYLFFARIGFADALPNKRCRIITG